MRIPVIALALVAVTTVAATIAPAQETKPAANPSPVAVCTGIAEADCGTTPGCVWLPGFKVPTGQEVKGYCRPAPKPLTARRPPGAEQPR